MALTITLSPTCINECSVGQTGCNSATQTWFCGEANDGDNCLDKRYGVCTAGYSCSNGICTPSTTAQCSDSDDTEPRSTPSSSSKYTKGSVNNQLTGVSWDSCASANEVNEHYCASATEDTFNRISCGPGYICSNGACINNPVCMDTDSSSVKVTLAGHASTQTTTVRDTCGSTSVFPHEIQEAFCNVEGKAMSSNQRCPANIPYCKADLAGSDDACVECLGDANCPSGYSCSSNTCVSSPSSTSISVSVKDSNTNAYLPGARVKFREISSSGTIVQTSITQSN